MFILKPIMFVSQVQILHAIFSASIKKLDKWTKICLMGVDLKSWARSSILERRFWDHEEDEKLKIHFSSLWNCNSVARYWNRSQKKEIFRKEEKRNRSQIIRVIRNSRTVSGRLGLVRKCFDHFIISVKLVCKSENAILEKLHFGGNQ